MRNYDDAFIFNGFFWDMSCNIYLLSSLNGSRDRMDEPQVVTLNQMNVINYAALITLTILKLVHLEAPSSEGGTESSHEKDD